jgi:hypothetical protein
MAPLSNACARRLLSSCSVLSRRARTFPCCSAKAPDAASEVPAIGGIIEGGGKHLGGQIVCSLGWGIPSALAKPEEPRPSVSSFWKDRPFGQSLLGYCLKPGCGLVKAAGLRGDAGQLVQDGAATEVSNLAADEISKVPEVKPVQNAESAGPQWKTCIICEHSKRVGDFARVKSSKDNRTDACRACLAALRGRRSGRELDHLQLTAEEAWKRAKICQTCNELKELRDFHMDSRRKDGLSSLCRGCMGRFNEKRPTRIAVDIPQRCKCCKEVKLACEFYPHRTARNGLQSTCKGCSYLELVSYRNQCSSEYVQRQTKLCTRCGITKQRTEFIIDRASIDGLHSYCKECSHGNLKQWRARRQEKRTIEASQSSS